MSDEAAVSKHFNVQRLSHLKSIFRHDEALNSTLPVSKTKTEFSESFPERQPLRIVVFFLKSHTVTTVTA